MVNNSVSCSLVGVNLVGSLFCQLSLALSSQNSEALKQCSSSLWSEVHVPTVTLVYNLMYLLYHNKRRVLLRVMDENPMTVLCVAEKRRLFIVFCCVSDFTAAR